MTFKEFAQRKTTISSLMAGREKLETSKLNGKDITILYFDIVSDSNGQPYTVYVTKEYPECFCYGGKVITDIFTGYVESVGSEEIAQEQLQAEGGLKVRLSSKKCKRGNNTYTAVEVL